MNGGYHNHSVILATQIHPDNSNPVGGKLQHFASVLAFGIAIKITNAFPSLYEMALHLH